MEKYDEDLVLFDLFIAYRKAKVDLYYSSNPDSIEIINYEKELEANLSSLLDKISSNDLEWTNEPNFIGTWTVNCKKLSTAGNEKSIITNPRQDWDYIKKHDKIKSTADFRIMEKVSIDFHILSSLWILKVGHKFDSKLGSNIYGNRLRRDNNEKYNDNAMGNFLPYLKSYKEWYNTSFNEMKESISHGKSIITIKSDVTSFYHNLNPDFIINEEFLNVIGLELTNSELYLTSLLINAIKTWSKSTPLGMGLPVGLSASAVIANMALFELDQYINEDVKSIYYGRYVDDIIIVAENYDNITQERDVIDWLVKKSRGLLSYIHSFPSKNNISFSTKYLNSSKIVFANNKNKVFLLEGHSGELLIESILDSLMAQSSEWRPLPTLYEDANKVHLKVISAINSRGDQTLGLNEINSIEVKKSKFAMALRDMESFERDLMPDVWKNERTNFFETFINYILIPNNFFTFEGYLQRVIKLACVCNEFSVTQRIISNMNDIISDITNYVEITISNRTFNTETTKVILMKWADELKKSTSISIISAISNEKLNEEYKLIKNIMESLQVEIH